MTEPTKSPTHTKLEQGADQLAQLSNVDPDKLRSQLISSYTEFEREFRRDYSLLWWATLLSPQDEERQERRQHKLTGKFKTKENPHWCGMASF